MGLSTQDHAFGSVAYWHSCYHAEMIWFRGWWTYLRTLTYTHSKSTWRHASHVCLFLLNVIKCCSDTAWCWLWWKKGALAPLLLLDLWWFIQRLPHGMPQKCVLPRYQLLLRSQEQVLLKSPPSHIQDVQPPSQWIGEWDFLNHVFLLFGQLYFSSFLLWCAESSGYCTAPWQSCVGPEWWRKAENGEWESK